MILLIAAEKQEFDGIVTRMSDLRSLAWPLAYAAQGIWQGRETVLVANGPGPKLAARAVQEALKRIDVSTLISTGFCGALHPDLRVGDMIAASEIRGGDGVCYPARLPLNDMLHGVVYSEDRVAASVADKRTLRQTGALAVEMEAAAVAGAARNAGKEFYCIRVVSDAADDAMPLNFNDYRDSEGRFDRRQIAIAALKSPFKRIPALLRLQSNCRLAAGKLGEFIADCRL